MLFCPGSLPAWILCGKAIGCTPSPSPLSGPTLDEREARQREHAGEAADQPALSHSTTLLPREKARPGTAGAGQGFSPCRVTLVTNGTRPWKRPEATWNPGVWSRREGALFENLFIAWVLYFFALAPPAFGGIKATSDMSDTTAAAPSRESRPSLELLDHLVQEVETVFHGKREVIRLALAAFPRARSRALRGRPRRGQDDALARAGADARARLSPHPVHVRPSALRRAGGLGLQSADRRVRDAARPDLYERRRRGRDQPGSAPHAERPPRGDAGRKRHDRRPDLRASEAFSRHGDAEPARAPRDLPAPGEPARPVFSCGSPSDTPATRPSGESSPRRARSSP